LWDILLKCTCTRTHDNINLFLRETRNFENRKPNYFYLLWRWIILFLFYIYKQQKSFVFCFCKRVSNLCWCALSFGIFCSCVCEFFLFLIRSEGADNATFKWCTISNQHFSSQYIFSRSLLQLTICHCQMNYKIPYLLLFFDTLSHRIA
jgi:hypothetical protein